MKKHILAILMGGIMTISTLSAQAADIMLPEPHKTGGAPLMDAIGARRSERAFDANRLPDNQTLSDLLWATWGISSADGRRTIPTARNLQNIELYVTLPDGVYIYQAQQNKLQKVSDTDVRPMLAAGQKFAADAPIHFLFIAQKDEMGWAAMHAGSMYQNAGLYCAANGLSHVVRGMMDREALQKALNLTDGKEVLVELAIGYKPQ